MGSPTSLLCFRLNISSSFNLSLQERIFSPLVILMTHSNRSMFFLWWELQNWLQYWRWDLVRAKLRVRILTAGQMEYCFQSWSLQHYTDMDLTNFILRTTTKMIRELEHLSCEESSRVLREEEVLEKTYCSLSVLMRKDGERLFIRAFWQDKERSFKQNGLY